MDPVGLRQRDLPQARALQQETVVVRGEGAGDASGPLPHVAAGRFVDPGVGDHIGDGEPPPGP